MASFRRKAKMTEHYKNLSSGRMVPKHAASGGFSGRVSPLASAEGRSPGSGRASKRGRRGR